MACVETLEALKTLKAEQKQFLRSPGVSRPNLASLVNPMVVRLNEAKHASLVADEGPMSEPGSLSHA